MKLPSTPYFQRREDWQPPQTSPDSPFRRFIVRCLKCGSFKLRLVAQFDEAAGKIAVLLLCHRCGNREILPVQ